MKFIRVAFLLVLSHLMTGCSTNDDNRTKMLAACNAQDPTRICGVTSPEDIARIADTQWAVFSQLNMEPRVGESNPGGLSFLNLETHEVIPILSAHLKGASDNTVRLGDDNCPGMTSAEGFIGHGLDVRALDDGSIVLAAVNHGEREAIELFSLSMTDTLPVATWRGCVLLERSLLHNDVALLADGSFYFTYFAPNQYVATFRFYYELIKSMLGFRAGWVNYWTKETGVVEVANSDAVTPNGILVSQDDSTLFVNEWMESNIVKLDVKSDKTSRDNVKLASLPDNSTWASNGKIIVMGKRAGLRELDACRKQTPYTTCDVPYEVYELDPISLEYRVIHRGTGAASVALVYRDKIFVGSFMSDSIQVYKLTD